VDRDAALSAHSSSLLASLERAGRMAEDAVLVLILGSMILLATAQIVLRNFFEISFIWSDEALRLMVLWIAVAGAVAASRSDKHINIAVLDRFLPGRLRTLKDVLIHAFTASVSGIVAWHSLLFVCTSHEFGDVLLGGVPAWLLQAVLPVGFGLICWRYVLFTVQDLRRLFQRETPA
jgi:TRAP-type C4-dicarboxylate transport system permease small subunit